MLQTSLKRKHWNPADAANQRCKDLFLRQMGAAQAKLDAMNQGAGPGPDSHAPAGRRRTTTAAADTDAARLQVRRSRLWRRLWHRMRAWERASLRAGVGSPVGSVPDPDLWFCAF